MAYTDDGVKAKLSALNETQESIVTVAQWIMFHRRYAGRTAQLWIQRLKESAPAKRLNLIYLANEVVQQSKARRKEDFLVAFSPMIADATGWAYKGASNDVQQKLRRVVEVWRQRNIFDSTVQEAVETRIDGLDKDRSSTGKRPLGGSLFSNGTAPAEIEPLVTMQNALSKAELAVKPATAAASADYDSLTDASKPAPSPPVHAARLSSLLKSLANAEGAVSESIKARKALIEGLENILKTNRETLATEEVQHAELGTQKVEIEAKKREVEDNIMRGLSADKPSDDSPAFDNNETVDAVENGRPEVEALTPPPIESFTPPEEPPSFIPELAPLSGDPIKDADDFLRSLPMTQDMRPSLKSVDSHPKPFVSPHTFEPKRRKMSHGADEEFGFGNGEDAMEGLDDEVKGMLETA